MPFVSQNTIVSIIVAQLAASPNATCVRPARFRQSKLLTTRPSGPVEAAKRYTRSGFCVSATFSRNVLKSNEI